MLDGVVTTPLPAKKGSRATRLQEMSRRLQQAHDLPVSDVAELLVYVAMTGLDPIEGNINKILGDQSPFSPDKVTKVVERVGGRMDRIRIAGFVDLATRIECARAVLPFVMPKLAQVQLADTDGNSIFDADRKNASDLAKDPEVRHLMETIAAKAAARVAESREE